MLLMTQQSQCRFYCTLGLPRDTNLADMPRPTEPVKRICYADDITVWASGVKIHKPDRDVLFPTR